MVNSIRHVFHKQIDSIEWMMDSESRQNAKTKLENMKYSSDHGILKVDDKWLDNGKFIISFSVNHLNLLIFRHIVPCCISFIVKVFENNFTKFL